jgi:type I restriction enzyme S subunit
MKLGDVCPFVYGKSLPSTVRDEAGVISVYGSNGVVGKHSEACVLESGVIVGRKGSVGEVHFSSSNFWPIDTTFYVVGSSKCDVKFAYYLLKSLDLKSMNSDSAIPGLNRDAAHSLEVSVPPLAEQQAIAGVLGALDDKIESNRRIQNLLELESQVLYERYYEYDPESSSCREVKLAELADINPARQLKKGSIAKYVEMSSLPTMNALIEHWEEREVGSGQKFLNGDTLVARITPCLENGKGAFVDFLDENEVAWGSTEYIVLRPHEPLPSPWAYCLSRTTRFRDFAIRHMNGSSGRQRCDTSALREYLVRVAPEGLTNEFTKSVTKNFERMGLARDENHALEKLRDALLPELLSGRLRVKDAESMMESV